MVDHILRHNGGRKSWAGRAGGREAQALAGSCGRDLRAAGRA